jgi:ABC-type multidrug transport system ATPase subunit
MKPAIDIQNLSRHFGDLKAVDGLSLTVQPGEIFGLLGPNGAGKTTTLHLIVGLLHRHGGEISVLGFDPQTYPKEVRRRVGLAPQETNVYTSLSALDNLRHHAALYCDDLSDLNQRIQEQLNRMNLWERRRDQVRTYSGGMKRRLALARALLHNPQIIFFDEPTLGVDVQGRYVLWEHIKAQRELGKTFIVSTNDMNEADNLCDRLVIIDHGKVIVEGSPDAMKRALGRDIVTLCTQPVVEDPLALFSGLDVSSFMQMNGNLLRLEVKDAENKAGELMRRVTQDHHLESIQIARPTLDDVFLQHTGRALRE